MIQFAEEKDEQSAQIRVVGVGGGGGNAINNMIQEGLRDVEFLAVNTDAQALRRSLANTRIQLGEQVTRGLGAGADPERGYASAIASEDLIRESLQGADMVFITAGMGGGTGTGAAPVIARIAQELGALTVGVVTKPFTLEGRIRARNAEAGVAELRKFVDTLLVIPNERIFAAVPKDTSARDALKVADNVLFGAVKGISDIITKTGLVNVDFADVVRVMKAKGRALMGNGTARGGDRATEAAQIAISSPLLEDNSVAGATSVLINITANSAMGMDEFRKANLVVQEAVHEDAEIILGVVEDDDMGEEMMVTVIATGFEGVMEAQAPVTARKEPAPARRETASAPMVVERSAQNQEIPTFIRREEQVTRKIAVAGGERLRRSGFPGPHEEEEEFEIPSFLRRQAD